MQNAFCTNAHNFKRLHIMRKYAYSASSVTTTVFCLALKYRFSNNYTELFLVILEAEELHFTFYC